MVDVAGDLDVDVGEAWIESGDVDPVDGPEAGAHGCELAAVGVEEPDTERRGEPESAVVCARVTAADDDPSCAVVERGTHQLPDAVGGGALRVALVAWHESEAGGGRHLEHRGAGRVGRLAAEADLGLHRAPGRAGDRHRQRPAVGGGDDGAGEPFAAVGHGGDADGGGRQAANTPWAMARATSGASRLSLKPDGAMRTLRDMTTPMW